MRACISPMIAPKSPRVNQQVMTTTWSRDVVYGEETIVPYSKWVAWEKSRHAHA
jgi:hypothetical protein